MPASATANALIRDLRTTFAAHANTENAAPMQAYMKSAMPFYGIKAPQRRRLQRTVFARYPLHSTRKLAHIMRALWQQARFREERYAAIELARHPGNAPFATTALLPLWQGFITEGAWWDFCDDISAEAIGPLLLAQPEKLRPVLLRWAQHRNIWLRRAAFLCQRRLKQRADAALLYACIKPSLGHEEFFLRKGIGWALRARAYDAPAEVVAFCAANADHLSQLSMREGLRVLAARGDRTAAALMRSKT